MEATLPSPEERIFRMTVELHSLCIYYSKIFF